MVRFKALTSEHQSISRRHSQFTEPTSYNEASKDPQWVEAMHNEIDALNRNKTWKIVTLPKGKRAIGSKWVYKVKLKSDGSLERYKARLVAKGYNQKIGIDFDETFSPVVKMTTIRCILSIAASNKWIIHQLDVNNAFLHGDLNEEVFMKMPEGIPNPNNRVCLLKKSLYGLKQASRQWHARLVQELKKLGYIQSKNDYSLFLKKTNNDITIIAVYVDDIIVTGSDNFEINILKKHLHETFTIKDLRQLHYFLGIEVSYVKDSLVLTQHKFTRELLQAFGITLFKKAVTPLPLN